MLTRAIATSSATKTMNTARASEHDAEHTTSFPSSEVTGASTGERVGGVGSLPGFVNESAVPKLPHERTDDERYITAAGAAAAVAGGAYALKDKVIGSAPSQDQAKQTVQETAQKVQNTAQSTAQTAKQSSMSPIDTEVTHILTLSQSQAFSHTLLPSPPRLCLRTSHSALGLVIIHQASVLSRETRARLTSPCSLRSPHILSSTRARSPPAVK